MRSFQKWNGQKTCEFVNSANLNSQSRELGIGRFVGLGTSNFEAIFPPFDLNGQIALGQRFVSSIVNMDVWVLYYYRKVASTSTSRLEAHTPPIYSPVWNIEFDELDFFPSLNWIFLPAVACKIQVWNRLKIKFTKLDISNWRNAKIKCR